MPPDEPPDIPPERWQVDARAAELYQRHLVPTVTAIWAEDLVARAGLPLGARVLDLACGTGVVARAAAERVGSAGTVAGLDVNRGMLSVAASLPPGTGARVRWIQASALALPFADASYDAVLCQLGLQFFPDPHRALAEVHRVLAPGGRCALNVFGPLENNAGTFALAQALDRHVGAGSSTTKRAEHSLSDPVAVDAMLRRAGFGRVAVVTVDKTVRYRSAADYVHIQLTATPLAALAVPEMADGAVLAAIVDDVATALGPHVTDEGQGVPQQVHVLVADAEGLREREPAAGD